MLIKTKSFSPSRPRHRLLLVWLLAVAGLVFLLNAAPSNRGSQRVKKTTATQRATLTQESEVFLNLERDAVPGVLFIKFKSDPVLAKGASRTSIRSVDALCNQYGVYSIEPAFPFLRYSTKKNADVLRRIYIIRFPRSTPVTQVCDAFARDENLEYAEPQLLFKITALPDDPNFSEQQVQLDLMNLPQAWDVIKGDSGKVVIAVVDGGTDWQHEDLAANIWVNEDEIPNNGIDDDRNGFVDDVRGWNFSNNTNDPKGRPAHPINSNHGTRTAGIAGAVTNNGIGIAGASWNAKIMPINAAAEDDSSDSSIQFGYTGIVYAAENGADIISNSWGGTVEPDFPFLRVLQDVIDFAHANGSVVIAAAGNNSSNNDNAVRLPSNLKHVLSVGSIDDRNMRSRFSNYGIRVGVFAPGEQVMSTEPNNLYGLQDGTSFSTPFAAGVAALVKTRFPHWSADQVREQVRVTATNIDADNPGFGGLMGKGRIDAFRAVTDTTVPAVRFVEAGFSGAGPNGAIDLGETIDLSVRLTNYLADANNLIVELRPTATKVVVNSPQVTVPVLAQDDTVEVQFQFELRNALVEKEKLRFILNLTAGDYSDRDIFEIDPQPSQIVAHNTGALQTTVTSKGTIGFLTNASDSNGIGFVLNDFNYLFEGGLMIGMGSGAVSNTVRGINLNQDDDFRPASGSFLQFRQPATFADEETHVVMVDSASSRPLGVRVTQETYAYKQAPFDQFIIFKYTLHRAGTAPLQNLRVGLFFDWDINADALDYSRYDAHRGLGIVQNLPNGATRLVATRILNAPGTTSYRAIDNRQELDLPISDPNQDGFTDSEKWRFLSDGIQITTLNNIDISTLSSSGPFALATDTDSVVVAFAVVAAESQEDLLRSADAAQYLWENNLSTEVVAVKPKISTSVFQNPAASKYADIVVVADRSLESAPLVELTTGGSTTSVPMSRVSGTHTIFRGPIEFTTAGAYSITTRAAAVFTGADTTQTRSYQVTLAKPGSEAVLTLKSGTATLRLGPQSFARETYVIGSFEEMGDETHYVFGPARKLDAPAHLSLRYPSARFAEPGKLFIAQKTAEGWQNIPTRVDPQQQTVFAELEQLGTFKLVYDGLYAGDNSIPQNYALHQNYPNPFNPVTTIEYDLPEVSEVVLAIYNPLGQVIRTLVQAEQPAGRYRIQWDGTAENGRKVASGLYFYQLKTARFTQTQKMILLQ